MSVEEQSSNVPFINEIAIQDALFVYAWANELDWAKFVSDEETFAFEAAIAKCQ